MALRITFSAAVRSRSGSPTTGGPAVASSSIRQPRDAASSSSSRTSACSSSSRRTSRRCTGVAASSRENFSRSPITRSMRRISASMRSTSPPPIEPRCAASASAACSRASGERSSCDSSPISRERLASRPAIWPAMRLKSAASEPSSSPRAAISAGTRASVWPEASSRTTRCSSPTGRPTERAIHHATVAITRIATASRPTVVSALPASVMRFGSTRKV